MKIIVPHHSTQQIAIGKVDKSVNDLLDMGARAVALTNQKKTWTGPRMDFSATAKVGFVAVPIAGNVLVDDVNVTIECELPAMARNLIGEEKIRATVENKMKGLLSA